MAAKKVWCVASLDWRMVDGQRFTTVRWCEMERRVRGKEPKYRDAEKTKCCGQVVNLPCGYEKREPTCDGKPSP